MTHLVFVDSRGKDHMRLAPDHVTTLRQSGTVSGHILSVTGTTVLPFGVIGNPLGTAATAMKTYRKLTADHIPLPFVNGETASNAIRRRINGQHR